METLVLVIHILVALSMIGLILIQQGKGAEAGASFGGGGAATVFGASGSANFLTRSTAVLITIFFVTSVTLAIFAKKNASQQYTLPEVQTLPAPSLPTDSAKPVVESSTSKP
ncbi:preprotein translocase subunit SecG [Alkanindiges sp. WGS2144]|uniref:preprotein translocase subunit SecG n=1 Tax=Alkanindiges sp. WGS2144 TaxID=3366808 RepID=UPI0037501BDB